MVTTIQLSEQTKQKLAKYKDKDHQTYEAVIKTLLKVKEPSIREMYGKYPNLPKWNKDRDRDTKRDA